MEEMRNAHTFLVRYPEMKTFKNNINIIYIVIILKWTLKNYLEKYNLESSDSGK
jgi:hypothetical protein